MENFEKLLEENLKSRKSIEPGSPHRARVSRVAKDFVFIESIPEKIRGVISADEFSEEFWTGKNPEPGMELDVFFLEEESGDYLFTHSLQGDDITGARLELSQNWDLPIWGSFSQKQANGWDVKIGDFLGFCPFSQIEPRLKSEELLGQKFRFVVTDIDKKKIYVSQRKIADREKQARVDVLKSEWKVGSFVTANIVSIQKSGLQVNLEGLQAFVPASEATYSRNANLEKEFKLGQSLKAKIIELDWTQNRVILSAKDFLKDPWSTRLPFKEGDIMEGTVESIKNFGLFVQLTGEFHGLVPNRETGIPHRGNPATEFQPGSKVKVFVMEVNPEKRQISLSIARAKETEDRMEYQKYLTNESEVATTSSFGLALKKSLEKKN
jgi:ribosomal protein S1